MKKSAYKEVTDAMEGIDDTRRDTVVYPDIDTVLGICECDEYLVLFSKNALDEQPVQMIWLNVKDPDELDALEVLQDAIYRVRRRALNKKRR